LLGSFVQSEVRRGEVTTDQLNERRILDAWIRNAAPWTAAVREGRIESRILATDPALVDVIVGLAPESVLDIGCGEGWLARALAHRGIRVAGVDAVPDLVKSAQKAGGGAFGVYSFADIASGKLKHTADVVVCNFSLLGKESVDQIFPVLPSLLTARGLVVVQTLHPFIECGDAPYECGWREGSWAGLGRSFSLPPPWYFRTIEAWTTLFHGSGLRLLRIYEPLDARTGKPASILFVASAFA
jgi:2-polyprenyl-3-methyl-5-hydroxy-6-metoxy-1,4-benzoquinol methylase